MSKISNLEILKKDLDDYAEEHCDGNLLWAYKDEIKDITCNLKEAKYQFTRAREIRDLLTLNELKKYAIHQDDLKEELAEFYATLLEIRNLI